jgi:hypothetical protein
MPQKARPPSRYFMRSGPFWVRLFCGSPSDLCFDWKCAFCYPLALPNIHPNIHREHRQQQMRFYERNDPQPLGAPLLITEQCWLRSLARWPQILIHHGSQSFSDPPGVPPQATSTGVTSVSTRSFSSAPFRSNVLGGQFHHSDEPMRLWVPRQRPQIGGGPPSSRVPPSPGFPPRGLDWLHGGVASPSGAMHRPSPRPSLTRW